DTMTYDANGDLANVTPQSVSAGTGTTSQQTLVPFDHLDQLRIINSPDPPLTATPRTITTNLGTPFSGATVASFVDADPNGKPGDYTASIAWGDGFSTPADAIVPDSSGGFDVLGSHGYNVP